MFLNFTKSFLCMGGLQCNVMQAPESAMLGMLMHDEDESDGAYVDEDESDRAYVGDVDDDTDDHHGVMLCTHSSA